MYATIKHQLDFGLDPKPQYTEIMDLHNRLMERGIPCEIRQLFDGWELCYPTVEECRYSVTEMYMTVKQWGTKLEVLDEKLILHVLDVEGVFRAIEKRYINSPDFAGLAPQAS